MSPMLDHDGGCIVGSMSMVTWATVFPDIRENAKCSLNYHKAYLPLLSH